jgi:hypothetical protein
MPYAVIGHQLAGDLDRVRMLEPQWNGRGKRALDCSFVLRQRVPQ